MSILKVIETRGIFGTQGEFFILIKTTELAALPFPKKGELRPPPELSTPNNKGLSFIRK